MVSISNPKDQATKQANELFLSAAPRGRRNPKISEVIAHDLATHIIESRLEPGAKLPTEKEMVEKLRVGRTTLREALRLLETRRVITIRPGPGGGPVVRRPRTSDLSDALTLILQFEGASLSDVLDAREAIEPLIARLAAKHITKKQIETLDETVRAMLDHVDDQSRFLVENQRFHTTIAEASGNLVLRVFTDTVKSLGDGAVYGAVLGTYKAQRRRAVAEAHTRIIEALRAGDEDAAEQAMKAHLEEATRYWQRRHGEVVSRLVEWRR
jgi:DNA-binding FadR family transcriptional regulator